MFRQNFKYILGYFNVYFTLVAVPAVKLEYFANQMHIATLRQNFKNILAYLNVYFTSTDNS